MAPLLPAALTGGPKRHLAHAAGGTAVLLLALAATGSAAAEDADVAPVAKESTTTLPTVGVKPLRGESKSTVWFNSFPPGAVVSLHRSSEGAPAGAIDLKRIGKTPLKKSLAPGEYTVEYQYVARRGSPTPFAKYIRGVESMQQRFSPMGGGMTMIPPGARVLNDGGIIQISVETDENPQLIVSLRYAFTKANDQAVLHTSLLRAKDTTNKDIRILLTGPVVFEKVTGSAAELLGPLLPAEMALDFEHILARLGRSCIQGQTTCAIVEASGAVSLWHAAIR